MIEISFSVFSKTVTQIVGVYLAIGSRSCYLIIMNAGILVKMILFLVERAYILDKIAFTLHRYR